MTDNLLKGGVLGQARMIALIVAGILVNILSLLPIVLIVVIAMNIGQLVQSDPAIWQAWLSRTCIGLVSFAFIILLVLLGPFFSHHSEAKKTTELAGICSVLGAVSIWMIGIIAPQGYTAFSNLMSWLGAGEYWILAILVCLATLFLAAGVVLGIDKPLGKSLTTLAALAGPALLLAAMFWIDDRFDAPIWWHWVAAVGLMLASGFYAFFINANQFTPHRYYRNRLSETYLLRKIDQNRTAAVDPQKLSEMRTCSAAKAAPYHLINAALNIPASTNPDLRGRNTDFFLFSQHYCGSPLLGYCQTNNLEGADPSIDLGTAIAISGAAASSYMGTQSISGTGFWLALFNIRLGYWLPNPRWIKPNSIAGWRSYAPMPWHFLFELTGNLNEDTKYVNLSDGGHIENLSLYELLRHRCKYIIALDGEADGEMKIDGLIKAIRFVQIDFGIEIDIDLSDLHKDSRGYSKAHFALGKIIYDNENTGLLIYIKSSMTGNERDYIQDYRANSPDFPHETTADQFFSEPQFEAYRALGHHIGKDLFKEELGTTYVSDVKTLFKNLAENLFEA